MEEDILIPKDAEFEQINQLYDECLTYLKTINEINGTIKANNKTSNNKDVIKDRDNDKEDIGHEIICKPELNEKSMESSKLAHGDKHVLSNHDTYELKVIRKHEIKEKSTKQVGIINENKDLPENTIPEEFDEAVQEAKDVFVEAKNMICKKSPKINFKVENEKISSESINAAPGTTTDRLRRLSQQLPKIVITQEKVSNRRDSKQVTLEGHFEIPKIEKKVPVVNIIRNPSSLRNRTAYGDFPKRLVSKSGIENVALISNVPYEKIRLLNDTFHTLINLRWRWIVSGTIVVHFAMWLIFAVFWYITALAHYDFEPDPPKKTCISGGKDFVTIFLASVEAQTTIGFGDRAIDEECPESIFLFIMQLILGTGLSGVLTCVVYAKLTRPEKLSRDGVGFSKKAVISVRDGRLCLMLRAWDLNYDHIIGSEFSVHFINTHRSKEGEMIRYYARQLPLQQRQFLLWPVTLVHIIDATSPLYHYTPDWIANNNYEITVSLKGASASMGTFTQSQTSYMPREIVWGHRFPSVVKFSSHKQKYVIDHKKLDAIEPVDTPYRSAKDLYSSVQENEKDEPTPCPSSPSNFSETISAFIVGRSSSFRRNHGKSSVQENEKDEPTPCPSSPSNFSETISAFVICRSSSFRRKHGKS